MELVYITLSYPYGSGETFCEDELKVAERYFERIYILSFTSQFCTDVRYVPPNAKVVLMRKRKYEKYFLLCSVVRLFSLKTIREIVFAKKELNVSANIGEICKEIFIYYYYNLLFNRTVKQEYLKDNTIFYSYWMSEGAYALVKMGRNNVKISRTHRYDCFIDVSYQPFRREILRDLDLIVSISNVGKKELSEKLLNYSGIDNKKIMVSHLGIFGDMDEPKQIEESAEHIFLIVSCSNINKIKRIDLIIDALDLLEIPVKWIHFGSGEEEKAIRKYSEKLKAKKNILFEFMGSKKRQEIMRFYASNNVDVFINSSDSEGVPVSIMEAMSYSIPVIARDVGGNSEIVNSYNGILLSEVIKPSELANAILKIYFSTEDERHDLRKNAFYTYYNQYNAEKNYSDFFEQLKKIKSR